MSSIVLGVGRLILSVHRLERSADLFGSDRYDAIRKRNSCLRSPDSEFWVQLAPGTAVVVDSHRVLHGRPVFTGKRRMCGASIGRDDYRARLDGSLPRKKTPSQRENCWIVIFVIFRM